MKKTSCYQCPEKHEGCHAGCPNYTQPTDKYSPRNKSESDYIDYVKGRSKRMRGGR